MENAPFTRQLEVTADGSHTLFIPEMDEHYHSVNGAVQESRHVFIAAGWEHRLKEKRETPAEIRVLEIGFGTGLNAFLTLLEAERVGQPVHYYSIELYPLEAAVVRALNYGEAVGCVETLSVPSGVAARPACSSQDRFQALHAAAWNEPVVITPRFTLHKILGDSNRCTLPERIDLVYFDAFAPDKQPEMWNPGIFRKLFACMSPGALLTTYCAKGAVRRMMKEAGYSVERIPGPPGKREMLRAAKQ